MSQETTIAIVPTSRLYYGNRFFKLEAARDNILLPWIRFRSELTAAQITCNTIDQYEDAADIDIAIFFRMDLQLNQIVRLLRRNSRCRIFLFAFEPPVVCGLHEGDFLKKLDVDRLFHWQDDYVDGDRLIKANEPRVGLCDSSPLSNHMAFADKLLVATIIGNKDSSHPQSLYKKRGEVMKEIAVEGSVADLYGRGWESCTDVDLKALWKGEVNDKLETLSRYKFTLCFENAHGYSGYVSEKIFDAFCARSVPIYWGASNINDIIPKDCYIDFRAFKSTADLVHFLEHMNEKDHALYLKNISRYMKNEFGKSFSGEALAQTIISHALAVQSENNRTRRSAFGILFKTFFKVVWNLACKPRYQTMVSLARMFLSFRSNG